MCEHHNKYNHELIKTYHTENFETFSMCDCEDETKVKVETEVFVYENPEGPNYEIEEITETCTACGYSREYTQGETE